MNRQPTPQQPDSVGEIRYRIRFLRKTYGACLNLWPTVAVAEYLMLKSRLRKLLNKKVKK